MQPKYRNNGDEFRPGSQFGRNRNNNDRGSGSGGFSRSYSKTYNPPSSEAGILMEAGRLAAEYLVTKGVLPASVLRRSSLPDDNLMESRGRESESQVPYPEGRTSALARLGNSGSGAGYGRRKFNDDYDRAGSRKSLRGRRRMGYYNDRGYGLDWSRDRGRNGSWNERSRAGYSDSMEDDDDFAPGYSNRGRRGMCDEVGSSVSRIAGEEQHSKSEAVGESGSELDDTGSKASSNSTKKEAPLELDAELNKGLDEVRVSTFDSGEVKSASSGELEKKAGNEDMDKPVVIEEASGSNHCNNLLSLCSFAKVPTRPRSSLAHKGVPVGQGPEIEVSSKVEIPSRRDPEMVVDEVSVDEPAEESHIIHVENSITEVSAGFSTLVTECKGERLQPQGEVHSSLQCVGLSAMAVDETQKDSFIPNMSQKVESDMVNKLPFISLSQENESYDFDGHTIEQSNLPVIMPPEDEEMFDVVSELKSVAATTVPKDEAESFVRMGEEKQNQPASFDLNLMDAPEILDIPDDPVRESCQTSALPPEGQKQLPNDIGQSSVGSKEGNSHNYNQISGDDKVIIKLEDDATIEANSSDSSKPRNEVIYPAVENVLDHTAHPDDLPVIQDSYGLVISDYLSCSPSVQADLNNLQVGMGLHGAEGFTGVEDSIYGSLGDIGFMEVWGQQSHDYEKFF